MYVQLPVLSACTVNSHNCPVVTGCGHWRLASTVDTYYMSGVQLKRKLKYTENAGVVASWLLHHDQYMRQYYSECYNRDMHMHNLED